MAGPSGLLSWAVEDSVFERLWGGQTAGARGGDVAVPGGVGVEVALPRSHLVEAARSELVEAHEWMGL